MKKILNPPDYVFLGLIGALVWFGLVALASGARADSLIDRVKGRILLQVQEHGEAWYVNPIDSKRYYLSRPADAFQVMRTLGLGITNADLAQIPQAGDTSTRNLALRQRLKGKILLQTEEHGEAWYVNPTDQKRYYLGRPADAFQIMRNLGLGITNQNLEKIERAGDSLGLPVAVPVTSPVPAVIKTSAPKKFLTLIVVNSAGQNYEDLGAERTVRFKENDDIKVFDITIWGQFPSLDLNHPRKISLYSFDNTFDPDRSEFDTGSAWMNYRESFNILDIAVPEPSSKAYLEAFKKVLVKIVTTQPAEHYGIKYLGHSSGGDDAPIFNQAILEDDAELLFSYMNAIIGGKIDFLDWNTQCGYGTYRVVRSQYPYADYILASDQIRGGYTLGQDGTYEDHQLQHTEAIETFFSPRKSIRQSLIDMLNSERMFWERVLKNNMTANKTKQSISIFDTSQFQDLMTAAQFEQGIQGSDVLDYIRQRYSSVEQKFYDFRFHYVNNKDFFTWDKDSNGFKF